MTYIPNAVLNRLVGYRMYSVEFVLNDYVQLRFDGDTNEGRSIVFNVYAWPVIEGAGSTWRETDLGYADALRRLTPGLVVSTTEETGIGIRIELDTGAIVIHPTRAEVFSAIGEIMGFADNTWVEWRPGGNSFEDI